MTTGSVPRYRVREEAVAAKIFEDEVIIIGLATNNYFSMRATGHQIWQMLDVGWSPDEAAQTLAEVYDIDGEAAANDVLGLIDELVGQDLIEPDPSRTSSRDLSVSAVEAGYTPPVLECFTDMQDLLALDPPLPKVADFSTPSTE